MKISLEQSSESVAVLVIAFAKLWTRTGRKRTEKKSRTSAAVAIELRL